MKVKKRNGELQDFDFNKIQRAVMKAFAECGVKLTEDEEFDLFHAINARIPDLEKDGVVDLEDIQNLNESQLMFWGYYDVAKAYIIYRYNRQVERDSKFEEKLLGKKIDNQNANVDEYSFGGRTGEASRIMTQNYALNHCMSKLAKERHLNNQIYTHDLDSYATGMHNCLTLPFDKLLANGFNTRQTDVRPANSVNTAFQLVAVLFQLQSLQQFGGVSASHLDWTMVPYVRKSFAKHFVDGVKFLKDEHLDKDEYSSLEIDNVKYKVFGDGCYRYAKELTEKELKQAVEGLYHNLNTLQSRSGNQLPFTSINYGTCTLPEGRMVISALLNGSINGVGKFHRTAIFPCGIFQIMKGVNKEPGTPNYDLKLLALKSTSLRLYPNYANVDWSGNAGYDRNDPRTYFSTMGK